MPQAYLWDDDYLDVVADAEDGWGREAAAVPETQGEAQEAPAPVTSAYASDAFRRVGYSSPARYAHTDVVENPLMRAMAHNTGGSLSASCCSFLRAPSRLPSWM
jgi:hypothetical protein